MWHFINVEYLMCTLVFSLMDRVIVSIQCSDLSDPIRRVAAERAKLKSHGINHNYSLYRDILFLAFVAIGRENIDLSKFFLASFAPKLYSISRDPEGVSTNQLCQLK